MGSTKNVLVVLGVVCEPILFLNFGLNQLKNNDGISYDSIILFSAMVSSKRSKTFLVETEDDVMTHDYESNPYFDITKENLGEDYQGTWGKQLGRLGRRRKWNGWSPHYPGLMTTGINLLWLSDYTCIHF